MKYKILKNVPIPKLYNTGTPDGYVKGPNSKYPWPDMEVGDALCIGPYTKKVMTNILTLANHSWCAKYMDYKFAARTIDGQIHIFRIQ